VERLTQNLLFLAFQFLQTVVVWAYPLPISWPDSLEISTSDSVIMQDPLLHVKNSIGLVISRLRGGLSHG
jgi:hypothetical protein